MSFVTRLIDLVTGSLSSPEEMPALAEEQLAAAALLTHVARVDGRVAEEERATILAFVRDGLGLPEAMAEALMERADRMDREVDDIADLIELMGHEAHEPDKRRLLVTAYRVAAADGIVREFEDDLVWRMGHLLGFDDAAIAKVRDEVVAPGAGA